jgi:hypothetical protein
MTSFSTPVLFLVFNRPDTTQQVFNAIRQAKPKQLFVAADGPRPNHPEELEKCEAVRAIIKQVDWDCEVKTLFRNENLGCGKAVSTAITWIFEHVERGIILEDDCLPNSSFFTFCEENLMKYLYDERVFAITGDNFFKGALSQDSYFFSRFVYIWGWATWKRSWTLHTELLKNFTEILSNVKTLSLNHKGANRNIINNAREAYNGTIDTWDYQWILSAYLNNGLVITPNVNLVKNIGFDERATHTKKGDNRIIIDTNYIVFPLKHPQVMISNETYDNFLYNEICRWKPCWLKLIDGSQNIIKVHNFFVKTN